MWLRELLRFRSCWGNGRNQTITRNARRVNKVAELAPFASTYLEIGVESGGTFRQVRVPFKWGIDPNPLPKFHHLGPGTKFGMIPSDDFFESLSPKVAFDIVFIDGLHQIEQVYRDLLHSIRHVRRSSVIFVDDVVPDDDMSAHRDQKKSIELKAAAGIFDGRWHGDVWKILPIVSTLFPGISVRLCAKNSDAEDNPVALLWFDEWPLALPEQHQVDDLILTLRDKSFAEFKSEHCDLFELIDEDEVFAEWAQVLSERGLSS